MSHVLDRVPETHYLHPEYEPPEPQAISPGAAIIAAVWCLQHQGIPGNERIAAQLREVIGALPDRVVDEMILAWLAGKPGSASGREVFGEEAAKVLEES